MRLTSIGRSYTRFGAAAHVNTSLPWTLPAWEILYTPNVLRHVVPDSSEVVPMHTVAPSLWNPNSDLPKSKPRRARRGSRGWSIWTTKVATLLRIQLLAASLAGLVRRVNYCQGLLTLDFLWVCFPNRPQAGIHRRCYNLLMSRLVARSLQTWTPMLTVAAKDSLNQPPYTAGQNGINCVTL